MTARMMRQSEARRILADMRRAGCVPGDDPDRAYFLRLRRADPARFSGVYSPRLRRAAR